MAITIEEVDRIASPLIRKYDWHTMAIDGGVRLTVTDGGEEASTDITNGEDVEVEITKLIEAVDSHQYPKIG